MFNKVVPAEYCLDSAKAMIDKVISVKSLHIQSTPNRIFGNLSFSICCSPCFIWSTIARMFCCPFMCCTAKHVKCNPCAALLTDSPCTQPSDECIAKSFNAVNEKINIRRVKPNGDAVEIIKYAAEKIKSTDDIKVQYLITDLISHLMYMHSPFLTITPQKVLDYASTLETSTKVEPLI